MSNPRRSNGARRTAALRWLRSLGRPCWICGLPIDYSLPAGDPLAMECDELVPVSRGGSPYDRENLAPAHRCCNNWRRNKSVRQVEMARASALRAFGQWSTPEQFVAVVRIGDSKEFSGLAIAPPVVTTEW